MPDDSRKALRSLLSYAEDLLRISEKVVADLSTDAVRVFHEYQIARLEGVSVGLSKEDWLRVARLRESLPPEPDAIFNGWLSGLGALSDPPKLAEKLLVRTAVEKFATVAAG